jgi:hypothetical protein
MSNPKAEALVALMAASPPWLPPDKSGRDASAPTDQISVIAPAQHGKRGAVNRVEFVRTIGERVDMLLNPPRSSTADELPFKLDLDLLWELAHQHMTNSQIADCVCIPRQVFEDILSTRPEVRMIMDNARAVLVQLATEGLVAKIKEGDFYATKFFLERKAEWKPVDAPAVVIATHSGSDITFDHIEELQLKQRELLARPQESLDE